MKTLYSLVIYLMILSIISCQKEGLKPNLETGKLFLNIRLSIRIDEVDSQLKSMQQTEDFKVIIYTTDGSEVMSFERAIDMPDTIELEIGNYYVEAHSDNNFPAVFENPYYFGRSDVFTIGSDSQHLVMVNCELANTIVSVKYSDKVTNSFVNYMATISSELGSLLFSRDETRMGYFQTLPLEIMVELSYQKPDGSDTIKVLSGNIPDPDPNKHYEIFVDASPDEGMASFQILLDSSEVQLEVINITDHSNNTQNGSIAYGDLLITEIMYNPSALSDTEGEWFEVFNNSDQVVNLKNLILGRDDPDQHIVSDSLELIPGAYYVFTRTGAATDANNAYNYGTDISLTNTGAILSIYNEGTETDPGELIFSVDYGGVNFPDLPGASISLNPNMINATDAGTGTSWCISTSVYNTGDYGTPGTVNDPCL
jgi:hypothetical protein